MLDTRISYELGGNIRCVVTENGSLSEVSFASHRYPGTIGGRTSSIELFYLFTGKLLC